MKGLLTRENALGWTAVRLHYSAARAKDPDTPEGQRWLDDTRRLYPDPIKFAQEFEINFHVSSGTRVYPEFNEGLHSPGELRINPRRTLYRGWDFGWHAPAVLVAQVDGKDRLVIHREIVGHAETTREFAARVIKRCAEWFPTHTPGYTDICDPTGQQVSSRASERSEARDVEVLNTLGIYPKWEWGWSRKDGRSLVHQLLQTRTDGTPGLYVNAPECPVLVAGFLGKYVYAPARGGYAHDEPDEGHHPWADVHACLRYLVTGLYSTLGLRRPHIIPTVSPVVKYHGYGTPLTDRRLV